MPERFRIYCSVVLLLIKDNAVLLSRRCNTGWNDGAYAVPAGHLKENESVLDALIREAREETGLVLKRENLKVIHVMHRKTSEREYIDFVVQAVAWEGEPVNAEPDKCDDMSWFPLDSLPRNVLPASARTLELYRKGDLFSEFGWGEKTD